VCESTHVEPGTWHDPPVSDTRTRSRPSYAERKQARMQRRIETWEQRLAGPPPPMHWHRALITLAMLGGMLFLLYLLTFGER
jgi:hypothetical protein